MLHVYLPAHGALGGAAAPAPDWTGRKPPIATEFVSLPGLITGKCVQEGGFSYLQIGLHPLPGASRTATINGDVRIGGAIVKSWGLHLIDVNLTEGDLTDLVGGQASAWLAKH